MEIDAISEDYDSIGMFPHFNQTATWNNREVGLLGDATRNEPTIARNILTNFKMSSSGKSFKIAPMGGSASVSAEKASNGEASVEAGITVSSDDGAFEVTASGSVDQDGKTSGKIEASINWEKD